MATKPVSAPAKATPPPAEKKKTPPPPPLPPPPPPPPPPAAEKDPKTSTLTTSKIKTPAPTESKPPALSSTDAKAPPPDSDSKTSPLTTSKIKVPAPTKSGPPATSAVEEPSAPQTTDKKPLSLKAEESTTAPPAPDVLPRTDIKPVSLAGTTPTESEPPAPTPTGKKPSPPATTHEKPLSLTAEESTTQPPEPPAPGVLATTDIKPVSLTSTTPTESKSPAPTPTGEEPPAPPTTDEKPLSMKAEKSTTQPPEPPAPDVPPTTVEKPLPLTVEETTTPTDIESASLESTTPTETAPTTDGLPQGIDLTKTPEEVQAISKYVKGVVDEHGAEILEDAIKKLNPDMSFQNPETIGQVDVTKLKPEQRVAYYLNLQKGSNVNKFLGSQYADNLYATNVNDGREVGQPFEKGKKYPHDVVQKDIDGKLRKLERMMKTQGDIGPILNSNIGSWIKQNDPLGYAAIQSTFDTALYGFKGMAGTGADKYKDQSLTDALTGLNTTAVLAQTYLAQEDFVAKNGDLSNTYHDVMNGQLEKAAPDLKDVNSRGEETPPPGPDASQEEYDKWYASLTENSGSKRIQPLVNDAFDQSEIVKKLKEAGVTEGSDTWDQYKNTFAKDVTMQYNNYWNNIRKKVKLDVIYAQTNVNGMFNKLPHVAGVDAEMFRAGAFHTVQNATLSAALAGSIIAGSSGDNKLSDPKTAMTLTYAVSNLADMVLETGSKYLDPKSGAFTKLGLNKDGKWTTAISKYLPGGDFKAIEAAGKMVAGAGSAVFGAVALWKTIDAVKNGETPAAVFNGLNAVGSTVSGVTLGAEGVLQMTNIARSFATSAFGMSPAGAAAFDAAIRGALASVGWAAGLVAGLGLTALGIYDMAKGVKVLDNTMKDANEKYIAPTTGWKYEFLVNPKLP
jgi:hypothetical protein